MSPLAAGAIQNHALPSVTAKGLAQVFDKMELENFEAYELDDTLEYLQWLMCRYCNQPSSFMAHVIITRLKMIQSGINTGEYPSLDWPCERLICKWQYLAQRPRDRSV